MSRISLSISPFFWVTAGFIGWINSAGLPNSLFRVCIWIFVVLISVLVHELGHALTALYFGRGSHIALIAFGGVTYPEGERLRGWREFLVVLNGPLFGLLLFLLVSEGLAMQFFRGEYAIFSLKAFQLVNLFWALINLLPVPSLDGGHLLRIICQSLFGVKGVKYALFIGLLFSSIISLASFFFGFFIAGAFFFLFAFQSFVDWRRARSLEESDVDGALEGEVQKVEDLLAKGAREEAIIRLGSIRERAKKGAIYNVATQHLANCKAAGGDHRAVYELLLPIKKGISPAAEMQLHRAAYEMGDYPLVVELSGSCFQILSSSEVALRNARSCAALQEVIPTIGWLKAARKSGLTDLTSVVSHGIFDSIREDPAFRSFLSSL